jgi:hypothetical protein
VLESYQARIPLLMDQEHIPGLALALVDGDQVVWLQGFGSTDTDGGTPVTVDTMFSVAFGQPLDPAVQPQTEALGQQIAGRCVPKAPH